MSKCRPFVKRSRPAPKRRITRWLGRFLLLFLVLSVGGVVLFRFVPIYFTPLMAIRYGEQLNGGKEVHFAHRWVAFKNISPQFALAVICSEDQNFFNHHGFDLNAIKEAVKESGKRSKRVRGASTISQQTAKNVFLWPGRSWLRKGVEAYFTVLIELFWSKERIIEVYLNSIEMGDGIYGAEAAANQYFKISAIKLDRRQAAELAAILPNPREYKVRPQTAYMRMRVSWILGQMRRFGDLPLAR
jgi:monofunctional biosynthetic peptidoglycan transglycosylase